MGILNTIQYKNVFSQVGNRLIWHFDAETLWIEAWGNNSLRVRCTRQAQMDESPWALLEPVGAPADIAIGPHYLRQSDGRGFIRGSDHLQKSGRQGSAERTGAQPHGCDL